VSLHRIPPQDVKYNIPVELWLPDRYPLEAPMLYVRPTPDMIIKPRHSFVDASGFVRSSYVVNWNTRCAPPRAGRRRDADGHLLQ